MRFEDLPEHVIVDQHGHYWRDFGDSLSMPPVSDENNKTIPFAIYKLVQVDVTVEAKESTDD